MDEPFTPPDQRPPGDPRRVKCPNCNAKPGLPCTQPTNTGRRTVTWHHLARESAARD